MCANLVVDIRRFKNCEVSWATARSEFRHKNEYLMIYAFRDLSKINSGGGGVEIWGLLSIFKTIKMEE